MPQLTQAERDTLNAHTPGPWLRIDTADYAEIHAAFRPSSQAVALVGKPEDADLIAAAPCLLESMEAILPSKLCGESWDLPDDETVAITITFGQLKAARAVAAKARGEAQ